VANGQTHCSITRPARLRKPRSLLVTKTALPFRVPISIVLGMVAAFVTYMHAVMDPVQRDFSLLRSAANVAVHGGNPYKVNPGLEYPLPGLILLAPWTPLPDAAASALFTFVAATSFAWALMANGYSPLIGFFSSGMLFAAQVGQYPPLFAGAFAIAPLGVFLIAKPHVGFATFVARPSWWPVISAAVCTAIAFVLVPTWVSDWRAALALVGAHIKTGPGAFPYTAPVLLPGGVLVLLALTRWRRPEARLLVALACVPQSMLLYEIVPLALVPRGWKEASVYLVMGHLIWRYLLAQNPWPVRAEYVTASGTLYTLFIFLPLTAMVLKRRNEGHVPAVVERAVASWPTWLRGGEAAAADAC
jgi:hypothetical protein